jgi:hypothetical protein
VCGGNKCRLLSLIATLEVNSLGARYNRRNTLRLRRSRRRHVDYYGNPSVHRLQLTSSLLIVSSLTSQ